MSDRRGVTRRDFLRGVGAAAAAGGVGGAGAALVAGGAAFAADEPEILGPGPVAFRLHVNGKVRDVSLEPRATLLDALRGPLGLTGPKEVCDLGACGACTVLLDGKPVNACMTLALDAATLDGKGPKIETVEGLATAPGVPGDLQSAFVRKDALQCGFCTCGMVVAGEAVLRANASPSADDVRAGLSGNLCRCGTYTRVVEAVVATATLRRMMEKK